MKKLFFLFLLAPAVTLAQYVTAEFVVLNNGTDADYNQLEKVWKVYHEKSVDTGEKLGWSVWKRTPKDNDGEGTAHYVIFNQFTSKVQRDDMMKGWSMSKATSIMKAGLKGKISSRTIDNILKKGSQIKKQVRQYELQVVDATPFVGGDLKKGDKMSYAAMTQKLDDYEQYESEVWKPMFEREILRNNFRWWGLTKIVNRNDSAYKKPTHLVWNIPVENGKPFMEDEDYMSRKMRSMMDDYREMSPGNELTLVYSTN